MNFMFFWRPANCISIVLLNVVFLFLGKIKWWWWGYSFPPVCYLFICVFNFVLFVYCVIFCVFHTFISCIVRSSFFWLLYCNKRAVCGDLQWWLRKWLQRRCFGRRHSSADQRRADVTSNEVSRQAWEHNEETRSFRAVWRARQSKEGPTSQAAESNKSVARQFFLCQVCTPLYVALSHISRPAFVRKAPWNWLMLCYVVVNTARIIVRPASVYIMR